MSSLVSLSNIVLSLARKTTYCTTRAPPNHTKLKRLAGDKHSWICLFVGDEENNVGTCSSLFSCAVPVLSESTSVSGSFSSTDFSPWSTSGVFVSSSSSSSSLKNSSASFCLVSKILSTSATSSTLDPILEEKICCSKQGILKGEVSLYHWPPV